MTHGWGAVASGAVCPGSRHRAQSVASPTRGMRATARPHRSLPGLAARTATEGGANHGNHGQQRRVVPISGPRDQCQRGERRQRARNFRRRDRCRRRLNGGVVSVDSGGIVEALNLGQVVSGVPPGRRADHLRGRHRRQHADFVDGVETVLGSDTSATVSAGGLLIVSSGGVATDTKVLAGGSAIVSAGGQERVVQSAFSVTIGSGGSETVSSGAIDTQATVEAGGTLTVLSAGTAIDTLVEAGGTAIISAGGVEQVTSGGSDTSVTLLAGGSETIASGGVARSTQVASGAVQAVGSGAHAENTVVSGGGLLSVTASGLAEGATVEPAARRASPPVAARTT